MTPSAVTPAGRAVSQPIDGSQRREAPAGTATKPARGQRRRPPVGRVAKPEDAHRRELLPRAAPRVARRLSGPREGLEHGALPGPRRHGRGGVVPRGKSAPLGVRVAAVARALAGHALLDRVVRGRAWIPLLGVMLAGIVAMQVEVLKLGASMGRSIERATALQGRNETLRASVSSLADQQRIERLAAATGMVMTAPDAVIYLPAAPGASARPAVAGIHAPDPLAFTARLPSSGANVAGTRGSAGAGAAGTVGATSTTAGTTGTAGATAAGATGG